MSGGGRKSSINVQVLAACLVSLLITTTSATTHVVGGNEYGWTTPTADPDIYSKWVRGKIFNVGDVLVFIYRRGHTVAEVSKAEYEHCAATHPISTATEGPVNVTINSPGDHYFICTYPGHCGFGQKVAITALEAAAAHPHYAAPLSSPSMPHLPAAAAATPSLTTPSASDVATTPPPSPSPPKSAAVGLVTGLLLPFSFAAAAAFLLSAERL